MKDTAINQWSILVDNYPLDVWVKGFLFDRKVQNMAKGTLYFYQEKLEKISIFMKEQGVKTVPQIDAFHIRLFLDYLQQTNHNQGGINSF